MRNNNHTVVRKITRRALGANKRRNFFIISAIALTAFMLTSVFSVGVGFMETIRIHPFRLEGTLAHAGLSGTDDDIEILRRTDFINEIGLSEMLGHAVFPDGGSGALFYIDGSTWERFAAPTYTDIKGRYARDGNEIMLSRGNLERLGIENAFVGMEIVLEFVLDGAGESRREAFILAAIFTEYVSARGDASVPIFVSEDFSRRNGFLRGNNWNIQVIFRSRARAVEYSERLAQMFDLGEMWRLNSVNPAVMYPSDANPGAVYTTMGIIIAFLMLTGFLLIYNVMYISVAKDVRFYGLLKTLGTTPRQLRRVVNFQVLCMYLIGLPVGLAAAAAASLAVVPAIAGGGSAVQTVSFSPIIFIGGAVFTLVTAYIGAFASARKAAGVSPIETVRYAGEQAANIRARRSAKGEPRKLAFRNVFRERRRAFVVLASLFLGVTVFTVVMTIVNSIDIYRAANEMYDHDFSIANTEFESIPPEIVNQIYNMPEVTEIRPSYSTAARADYDAVFDDYIDILIANDRFNNITRELVAEMGLYFPLRGVDDEWVAEWNERRGRPLDETSLEAFKRGEMVLLDEAVFKYEYGIAGEEAARLFPVGAKLDMEIGWDESDENIRQTVTIGGLADFNHGGAVIGFNLGSPIILYMSAGYLRGLIGEDLRLTALNINAAEGRDEAVYNALRGMLDSSFATTSRHEARISMTETRRSMLATGAGLSAILGVIGIFNFINVISVGLLARKREFAALECAGMAKRQTRAMLRWEGAIYWITKLIGSAVFGNALAVCLYSMIRGSGEPMYSGAINYPFVPITAAYAIIVLICSVTPEVAYKSMNKQTLVERLREAE